MNLDSAIFTLEYIDFQGTRVSWDNTFVPDGLDEIQRCVKHIQGGTLIADFKDHVLVEHYVVVNQGYI